VYERILPRLNLPALRYHGYFDEGQGDFCWLFFEDAGTEKVREPQCALPSAWIAQLHIQAAGLTGEVALPERGSSHYLDHLRSARRMIDEVLAGLSNAHDDGDDVIGTLRDLQVLLDRVEARWDAICAPCATAPRTLVHGDFGPKNVRLRSAPWGTEVVVLDWETAGWGPIAVDIPQLPSRPSRKPDKSPRWRGVALDVYTANASGAWDGADKQRELARLAAVGTVFRYLSSIRWAAEQVHSGGTLKPMARLRLYTEEFMPVVAAMGC
jgi:hypothetical protein